MDLLTHAASGAVVGAAFAPDDRSRVPLMLVGAAAGLLPDLDALAGRASAAAAWRYHRVGLHGVPMVPVLAAPLVLAAMGVDRLGKSPAVPLLVLAATVTASIQLHLLLDTLTSFGTALLFPFSRRRFSTHSHFIVDVPILACLLWGLAAGRPAAALLACGIEMVLVIGWRAWLLRGARRAIGNCIPGMIRRLHVEPGLFAPLRWSVMATFDDGHTLIATTMLPGALWTVEMVEGAAPAAAGALDRARTDPLVAAYLETVELPHAEWIGGDREPTALIVEDLKWRVHRGVRPLRLLVPWRGGMPNGAARELPMRGNGGTVPSRHSSTNLKSGACEIRVHSRHSRSAC